jgi:hypothetical protein
MFDEPTSDTGWAVVGPITYEGRVMHMHVVPNCDLRHHQLDPTCWCNPVQDEDDPLLWGHNSLDQRERYEQGDRRPN